MPVVAAVVAYAVDYAVVEMGVAAAIETTVGAGLLADAATGALVGAVSSGITGGDIEKGALMGGVGGAVAGQFKDVSVDPMKEFQKTSYPGQAADLATGEQITKALQSEGVSSGVAEGVSKGVGRFAAGTAGGLAGGQDIATAAERGLIGAGTGAAKDILFPVDPNASKSEQLAGTAERALFDVGASSLFSSNKGGVGATSFTPQSAQTSATLGGSSPSSEALAQALRLDPGSPVFGGEKEKGKKSGWNVESLRYMGNSEA